MVTLSPAISLNIQYPISPFAGIQVSDLGQHVQVAAPGFECKFRKFAYPYFAHHQTETGCEFGYRYSASQWAWQVEVAGDRVSIHTESAGALPLYYFADETHFYASTDFIHLVKSLVPVKLEPNIPVIVDKLMLESSLHDETFLHEVKVLHENVFLRIDQTGVHKELHASSGLSKVVEQQVTEDQAVAGMTERLRAALQFHTDNLETLNLTFGNGLSGGKDSSTVAHITHTLAGKPLDYYSLVLPPPQERVQMQRLESFAKTFLGKLNTVKLVEHRLLPPPTFLRQAQPARIGDDRWGQAAQPARIECDSWGEVSSIGGRSRRMLRQAQHDSLFDPMLEIYRAATSALAHIGQANGISAMFTGFGGDELFMIDMFEEEGFAGSDAVAARQRVDIPFFYTEKFATIYREASLSKPYPEPLVAHSVRSANAAYNPFWHDVGIWPLAPLGDLELTKFCRSLPGELRHKKKLFDLYQQRQGFPEPFLHISKKDSFGPFYLDALTNWALQYLEDAMRESPLADLGLIDPVKIMRDFKYNILTSRDGSRLGGRLFQIIMLDMFFKNYRKGGKQS